MGLPAEVLTYRPQDLLFISYTALVNLSASVLMVQMQHWFRLLMILVAYATLGGVADSTWCLRRHT